MCWNVDVTRTSFRPKNCDQMLPYNVIFFDPPYKMVSDIRPGSPLYRSLERLSREGIAASDALLLFRTPKFAEFELPPIWQIEHVSEYSTMTVHWFRRKECGTVAEPIGEAESASPDSNLEPAPEPEQLEP